MSINPETYNTKSRLVDGDTYNKWKSYMSSQSLMEQMNKVKNIAKKATSPEEVDPSTFDNVGKDTKDSENEEDNRINAYADAEDPQKPDEPLPDTKDSKTGKTTKSSIFPMIFKVVPIGINIFRKFPKVMSGLMDITIATQTLIVNTILTTADLVPNGLAFIMLSFVMGMYNLMCIIMNIKNLHICCIPYLLDLVATVVILTLCSFVSILDTLFLERLIGFPLFDIVRYAFQRLGEMIQYPDFITELCYKCKLTQDNILYDIASSTSKQTGQHIGKVVTKDVPKRVVDPVMKAIGGITKMTSIFNI